MLSQITAAELVIGTSQGLGLALGLVVFRSLAALFFGRLAQKETQLDASTQRLIGQLENQVKELIEHKGVVEKKLADCLERDIEKERRIAHLEGLNQGWGDADQHAQLIIAAERAADKRRKRDKE